MPFPLTMTMFLDRLTSKDDLERVAGKDDLARRNAYLKTRPVLVPRRPRRFLDAATFTQEQWIEQIGISTRPCGPPVRSRPQGR
jgi:hypothetical protein